MSRRTRVVFWTFALIFLFFGFLLLLPSLFGALLAILLVFAVIDYSSRRYRNAVQTFNASMRAVCHHEGAISKVALAFSKSGPLSGPCYEYARRLMMGENPVDAAAMARVPLQLGTAVALQSPARIEPDPNVEQTREFRKLDVADPNMMPAYGQFLYLTVTALITCSVLVFMGLFVAPTLETMYEEFFASELPNRWMMRAGPAFWILMLLGFVIIIIVPLLNRGHIFGLRLAHWIPMMPRPAQQKADTLNGLADAVDAGWPIGRALAVGHTISTRSLERRSLEHSMILIERGTDPTDAMQRAGLIDPDESSWLRGATPRRTAELLRSIADQTQRDAQSNLRWLMAIFFPCLVMLLGLSVLAYAYGFFGALTELINGLA